MKQDMDFSISHLYLHGVVYTPLNRPAIIDEAHFSGKTIAAVRGSMAWSNALANAGSCAGASAKVPTPWRVSTRRFACNREMAMDSSPAAVLRMTDNGKNPL